MPLVAAVNLKHAFGNTIILDGCSLSIEPGDRIGMVGRNGTGKTTLFKALVGRLKPDQGEISVARGVRVGYLSQDPDLDPEETLKGSAEAGFAELHRLHVEQNELYEAMATATGDALERIMKKHADLEHRIEEAGGYAVDHKIEQVLHGLGFTDSQFNIKVKSLSGGQKGRVALARLLLEQPDVLLLDEPTNHLDLAGRLWLEDFLTSEYQGAVLMISHDRYLLDAVVNKIVEVEQGRLIDYPGNYEAFRETRALRRLTMHRAYEKQQDRFKKEEEYIRRFKAGQRARQAQGRLSKLEREKDQKTLERPMELASFNMSLKAGDRTGDIVVAARGISKSYPAHDGTTKVLFKDLDVVVKRGERWGIIGPNGAGKSTLVSVLLGLTPPDAGSVRLGSNVKLGYYRQTHEHVPHDSTVWRYLQNVIQKENPGTQMTEQAARNLAGAFLFSGDEQERDLGTLSGGERSRAVIAGLLASAKNLLVLDEPTNHLDIPSAERLEMAMSLGDEESVKRGGYDGTLLLISHDRAFIDATCDNLLILDGEGGVRTFTGNYSDWHEKEQERAKARKAEEAEAKRRAEDAEKKRKAAEEEKKRQAATAATSRDKAANPFARLKTEQIEKKIEETQSRIAKIDSEMTSPDVWRDPAKCQKLGEERTRLVRDLEPLEFEWLKRTEA
jgi:ATP-binding cassette subfamily F protein 3